MSIDPRCPKCNSDCIAQERFDASWVTRECGACGLTWNEHIKAIPANEIVPNMRQPGWKSVKDLYAEIGYNAEKGTWK